MSKKTSKQKKQKQKQKSVTAQLLKGKLEVTRSGMGYVVIDNGSGDVLVRPGDFMNALNGDVVRVKVVRENGRTGKKEGKITEVISRRQTEFIGYIQLSTNFAFFVPDTDKPMPDLFIPLTSLNGAKNKDRVVARLVKWEKEDKKPVGEVVSVMQPEDENDAAMKELLAQAGFPLFFPEDVLEEAERLPDVLDSEEIKKRKDCREIRTFTIDPVDAKDFDDAISIRKLANGIYEIGVHIADVSYYVHPETELDEEAYKRATSVYLPDRVNPMLPERISNELCSLRPHEDKFTFSAIFQMNAKGEIKQYWLGRTVIHSDHRFTYEDVQEIIETKEGKFAEDILLLNDFAQKMRKKRFSKGAINFSSQEVRFKLDEKGKPVGIVVKESKEAHQLIEEFMLLANRTVAENISKIQINKKQIPFPYRVHDQPDAERLAPFMEFAKKYGHKFDLSSPESIAASFNQMLADAKGKPEQHVLEQLGIRTMAKAVYTTENIGHYGLAFEFYCHFTSPIRRYPDVLVHRVLETVLQGKPMIDKKMEEKCKHSSDRERAAMECERAGNKYKQVEYMRDYLGESFEGVVSGVASFGFWVETVEHKCEGLVSLIGLSDYDDFRLVESDYSLVGRRSGRTFRMGDKVTIRVVAANLEKRQLDYEWVMEGKSEKSKVKSEKETGKRKKK
ncbi:MAG: ribonuclease R [Sediminibacterium sp.]|jgi:ribonuclease R|uniref:ribonuclease R n=1 Tax=Sediminibacterium sp. TaxID=1917865 RepID=UPI002AB91F8C|nr:ribonuclease R [Sediminibacterium sp.]MDZ4072266.1 ribonuclease R [Sediminibacterium sp.]